MVILELLSCHPLSNDRNATPQTLKVGNGVTIRWLAFDSKS